jgi:hypothetical protein
LGESLFRRVVLGPQVPRGLAHTFRLGVLLEAFDGFRPARDVRRGDDDPGDTLVDRLGQPSRPTDDDGNPGGVGLEDDSARALV